LLLKALDRLVARHEALRTTFIGSGPRLTQLIHEPEPVSVQLDSADSDAAVMRALSEELRTPIDFTRSSARIRLWRLSADQHLLCINMHHLVTDAWSCGVLYRELGVVLDQPHGDRATLPGPSWQYADFTAWQYSFLDSSDAQRHRDYWTRQLAGMTLPAVPLRPRPPAQQRTTAIAEAVIDPPVGAALRRLACTERTTLFAVMLATYYATLHRVTGQADLAVTSLFANRTHRSVAGTVGFVANMVVLRVQLSGTPTFADLVRRTAATAREAFLHESLPYQLLPLPSPGSAHQRTEDVVFQMLGEPIEVATRAAGLVLEGVAPQGVARFDLELAVIPQKGGLAVSLFYARERLVGSWAQAFVESYVAVATAGSTEPDRLLATLPVDALVR
jgi:hypothetical protein